MNRGYSFFQVPCEILGNTQQNEWRANFIAAVTKTRCKDAVLRERIKKNNLFVCSKLFLPTDYDTFVGQKITKRKLKFGAVPHVSMPVNSIETSKTYCDPPGTSTVSSRRKELLQTLCIVECILCIMKFFLSLTTPIPPKTSLVLYP